MIKKSLYLFAAAILTAISVYAGSSPAESRTFLGVFYFPDTDLFGKAGLRAARKILKDHEIKKIYGEIDKGTEPDKIKVLRDLESFNKAGADIIVTLRWPANPETSPKEVMIEGNDNPRTLSDRVPAGKDKEESLKLLRRFLADFGPKIKVISLQNECLGGPGRYSRADMSREPGKSSPAGAWLKEVAETVKKTRAENPRLAHLKIASPVWQGISRLSEKNIPIQAHHEDYRVSFLAEITEISNKYCDYVDVHFLQASLADIGREISYIKRYTNLPLITTEWAGLAGVREWLKEPVKAEILERLKKNFPGVEKVPKNNEQVVRFAQKNKFPVKIWNEFLKDMPHEKDFALESFKLFEKEKFAYACWALGFQYSHVLYDLNTLFANMKTLEKYAPNEPAYGDFQRVIEYTGGKPWAPRD